MAKLGIIKNAVNRAINKIGENMTIPLINASSPLAAQGPIALDTPHQVTFGPAQGSASDDIQLLADGTVRCNVAGNYALRLRAELGRVNTGGVVDMLFRTTFNGVQIGNTTTQKLESRNVLISLDAYVPALLGAGDLKFEIMRDSQGTNDGELQQFTPTDVTWSPSATANVQVYRIDQEI